MAVSKEILFKEGINCLKNVSVPLLEKIQKTAMTGVPSTIVFTFEHGGHPVKRITRISKTNRKSDLKNDIVVILQQYILKTC
jgi:hypothetical protein